MESTYNTSLIYTNNRAEIRFYSSNRRRGFHSPNYGSRKNTATSRASSNQRAKKKLINLINQNFDKNSFFITLTFKENVTHLDVANKTFYSLIRKIRYNIGPLKYCSVIEFQKRGAIHYHMLMTSKESLEFNTYLKKWRDSIAHNKSIKTKGGSIRIEPITNLDKTIRYVTKYLTKSMGDTRLCGKKAYLASHNLKSPENYYFMLQSDNHMTELCKKFPLLSQFDEVERTKYKDKLTNKTIHYIVLK